MALKYRKSYRFAFKSTLLITIFSIVILLFLQYLFYEINLYLILIFSIVFFIFTFFILQFRVEHFIYKGIEKIFKSVSLLEQTELRNQPVTTDMKTLMKEINKFATDKKIEIESLKVREEYRREFIGNVAHELKTPLFTVQGYISTLIDGGIEDKNIIDKYLKRADNGVERLIEIVDDLDMITKLETSELKLEITRFDIVQAFKDVFEMFELKAEEKDITLMFDKENYRKIFIKADKEKISRVIVNLIENSIKYGKPKGTTEVSFVHLTENKLLVRVTDNGLGIHKKHIHRIFERFYRIESSRSREVGGSGLGLSIVKHIVEAHNEHIYLESKIDSGSEFSFTIQKSVLT